MSMNSDDEKALFEEWGWEYNFIKRHWLAPTKGPTGGDVLIKLDDLVDASIHRMSEDELRSVVATYGKRS